MCRLISVLLFPGQTEADASLLAPQAKSWRVGASVRANAGGEWRLVREASGAASIHRRLGDQGQYQSVAQDSGEMARVVSAELGVPEQNWYEQYFFLSAAQLPSKRPLKAKNLVGAMTTSGGLTGLGAGFDSDPMQPRLAALQKERALSEQLFQLQFELDSTQAELEKLRGAQAGFVKLGELVAEQRGLLAKAPTPRTLGLPEDIVNKLRRWEGEAPKHQLSMSKLEAVQEEIAFERRSDVAPLKRDLRFWAALMGGLAVLALSTYLGGQVRFLSLAAIPPFTFAALLALRFVDELQSARRTQDKSEVLGQTKRRLDDERAALTALVQKALRAADVSTVDDFVKLIEGRDAMALEFSRLEGEYSTRAAASDTVSNAQAIIRAQDEVERLSSELAKHAGGYVREVREIDREIAHLSAGLASPARSEQVATPLEDLTPMLLTGAAQVCATDVATLWGVLRHRVSEYLAAFSERSFESIDIDGEGLASVVQRGRRIAVRDLLPRDADLAYLSLRLCLIERLVTVTRLPVVIEDAFRGVIDSAQEPLFSRMLKHLSARTQVIHVTGMGYATADADLVASL
jgi:hypothetical protein